MTDISNLYKADTRQTREYIIDCITTGLVPFIQSSPAMGKSSIVKSIAEEYNLELIDHRLSTSAPEDLTGLPYFEQGDAGVKIARFAPFDTFPIAGSKIPDGKQGWLLFLDEFNSAPKSVQAAAYKLILDKMVGQNRLHENVLIVCAGNLATDRAIVNRLSTAMQSRVIHILMELKFNHFMEDVAFKYNWDNRITAFLSYMPGKLYDFRPDHNELTFCSPRTWEFMNKLISGKTFKLDPNTTVYEMDKKAALYAGTITSGVAVEFIQFTKVFKSLPTITDIMANPFGMPIPNDSSIRYATIMYIMEHMTEDNFSQLVQYVNRFGSEFRVLLFRGLIIRKPELRSHPDFIQALIDLKRYFYDSPALSG